MVWNWSGTSDFFLQFTEHRSDGPFLDEHHKGVEIIPVRPTAQVWLRIRQGRDLHLVVGCTSAHRQPATQVTRSETCSTLESPLKRDQNTDVGSPFLLVDEKALEDFEGVTKEGPIDAVVVGLAPAKFHYDLLNEAFR